MTGLDPYQEKKATQRRVIVLYCPGQVPTPGVSAHVPQFKGSMWQLQYINITVCNLDQSWLSAPVLWAKVVLCPLVLTRATTIAYIATK